MNKTDEIIKSIITPKRLSDAESKTQRFREELKAALEAHPDGLSQSDLKEVVRDAIAIALANSPQLIDDLSDRTDKIIDENFGTKASLILLLIAAVDTFVTTESQFLENQEAEKEFLTWDEDSSLLYNWQIVDDSRTTTCCRNIKKRAGEGKTLEELRKIVNDESRKYNSGNPHFYVRDWNPHINCRSRLVREKM